MEILEVINSSSGYLSVLQAQALGPANARITIRDSPIFCFQEEGKSWHGWGSAQGLAPLPPRGSSLSSVACCK